MKMMLGWFNSLLCAVWVALAMIYAERIERIFLDGSMLELAGFYALHAVIFAWMAWSVFLFFLPRSQKKFILSREGKVTLELDENNLRSVLLNFLRTFPEIVSPKVIVENKVRKIDLTVILKIKASPDIPKLADNLKEKTISFLKELYARDIIDHIRFVIQVEEKTITKNLNSCDKVQSLKDPGPASRLVEIPQKCDKTITSS